MLRAKMITEDFCGMHSQLVVGETAKYQIGPTVTWPTHQASALIKLAMYINRQLLSATLLEYVEPMNEQASLFDQRTQMSSSTSLMAQTSHACYIVT